MDKDNWFAGFADGEGSFYITKSGRRGGTFLPCFSIQLRADDRSILELLKETFGGTIVYSRKKKFTGNGKEYTSNPLAHWTIRTKSDLPNIVNYFDKFPLRSKKKRDYKLWRLAVNIYIEHGCRDKRLSALQQAIRDGRKIDGISNTAFVLEPQQLDFGEVFSVPSPH